MAQNAATSRQVSCTPSEQEAVLKAVGFERQSPGSSTTQTERSGRLGKNLSRGRIEPEGFFVANIDMSEIPLSELQPALPAFERESY